MGKHYSIAIDGPAGAGKSTIAKALAKELGFHYVDTGAIYRTLGYFFNLIGIGPKDIDGITKYIDECVIEIEWDEDGSQHMFLNEIDVSEDIRTPRSPRSLPAFPPTPWSGIPCWTCSGMWPGSTMSSWTAGTSAPWSCPRRM